MIGDHRQRVRQLEDHREEAGNLCPECGFAPDDVRVIVFGIHDEPRPPMPEWPPEDYCGTCGKLLPPVRLVDLRRQTAEATA